MGYRIKTVARMTNIPRSTLLAWERRYGIVQPLRAANGYREYTDRDVETLRELKRLIDGGHRVSEALSLMQAPAPALPVSGEPSEIYKALISALLRADYPEVQVVLRRIGTMSFDQKIDEIYFPMLRSAGELWQAGELSVAQEHIISTFCREQLVAMLLSVGHGTASGRLAICSSYAEEQHDLALLGVSVKLALRNHRIIYLGARTPQDSLDQLITQHRPALTCVSVTMPTDKDQLVADARRLAAAGSELIIFGGPGLPPAAELPEVPGLRWVYSLDTLLKIAQGGDQ